MTVALRLRRLSSIMRTPAMRLAAIVSAGIALSMLLLFVFIFWQTTIMEAARVNRILERDAAILSTESLDDLERAVNERVTADFHRVVIAALFDKTGQWVAGNLERIPENIPADGKAHRIDRGRFASSPFDLQPRQMVVRRLPDGHLLVIGRSADGLEGLRTIVGRALALGIIPAVFLSLGAGALFGYRAQKQITTVCLAAERIICGNLEERLPVLAAGDDLGRLTNSVNRMLDEIGVVIDALKTTGQSIAHDLRTPLTRVRLRLEQAAHRADEDAEVREMVGRAIAGLDHALRIITSLLRIGQFDSGYGRDQFGYFDLKAAVQNVADLYLPIAAEKQIAFDFKTVDAPPIYGDKDLIIEAVANIVDNAVKYTQSGGEIILSIDLDDGRPLVRVSDNGPGIAPEEASAVMERFYRSQRTTSVQGFGLGLSLVDSIARLHGFHVAIKNSSPGCVFELRCFPQPVAAIHSAS